MPLSPRRLFLAMLALGIACSRVPSHEETLIALHDAFPSVDRATAFAHVWRDGPPWYSCAELIAKSAGGHAPPSVREVSNWRSLVVRELVVLRDTSAGVVTDPGWCTAHLTADSAKVGDAWRPDSIALFPTGAKRRGWVVRAGAQRLVVGAPPESRGRDEALVHYGVTIAPNASGAALGLGRDTVPLTAVLRYESDRWRVVR